MCVIHAGLTVMTDELAPVIALLGACGTQSQSLRARAIGIHDIQVVDLGCSRIVPQGGWYLSASVRIGREYIAYQTDHFLLQSRCCV